MDSHLFSLSITVWSSRRQEYVLPVARDIAIIEEEVHGLILVASWWEGV